MWMLIALVLAAGLPHLKCEHRQPLGGIHRNMIVRINNRMDNQRPARNVREGRVEVSHNNGRTWGTICASSWSKREGNVVCRQLKLGYAEVSELNQRFGNRGRHPWSMVGIICRGNERTLRNCRLQRQTPGACNATNRNLAMVKCVPRMSDLQIGLVEIERTGFLDTQPLSRLRCAMEENCLARDAYQIVRTQPEALRKLLRFNSKAENVGTADFSPYLNYDRWQWHQCHAHYHSMEAFANFDIFDTRYNKMAQGHKASFCLMDTGCRPGIRPRYTCGNRTQGISIGCDDTYSTALDCQWVDVTSLPINRNYILRVSINPDFMIGEISYENNAAECSLHYTGDRSTTKITNCRHTHLWYGK